MTTHKQTHNISFSLLIHKSTMKHKALGYYLKKQGLWAISLLSLLSYFSLRFQSWSCILNKEQVIISANAINWHFVLFSNKRIKLSYRKEMANGMHEKHHSRSCVSFIYSSRNTQYEHGMVEAETCGSYLDKISTSLHKKKIFLLLCNIFVGMPNKRIPINADVS